MIKLNFETRIDEEKLKELIVNFTGYRERYIEQEQYYIGNNPPILGRQKDAKATSSGAPDWKVPVAYGRKLVKTVSGYLYKPGNITYTWGEGEDQAKEIFKNNTEPSKTNTIRSYSVVNGVSYELHYLKPVLGDTEYKFALVKAADGFPVYSADIEPILRAFIMLIPVENKFQYEVYYDDEIITYEINKSDELVIIDTRVNFHKVVPVVVNKNNEEQVSDIQVVKNLIDSYDVLCSDSMNEFDRFAWAYLVMTGKIDEEDLKNLKDRRIFEGMENGDAIKFLTKEIPSDFIQFMSQWLKTEIHSQSFIPNIEDLKFSGAASGIAIDKFIYLMEYNVSDKEAFTKIAIQERIDLMNKIPGMPTIVLDDIVMKRNLPAMEKENAELFVLYDGRISKETNIKQHATFVKDVDEEMERINQQKDPSDFGLEE